VLFSEKVKFVILAFFSVVASYSNLSTFIFYFAHKVIDNI